jgi:hypothetical protein
MGLSNNRSVENDAREQRNDLFLDIGTQHSNKHISSANANIVKSARFKSFSIGPSPSLFTSE